MDAGRNKNVLTSQSRIDRAAMDVLAVLCRHPIFGGIERVQLQRLASFARTRTVQSGTTIFAKGDPGIALYAISAGKVKVSLTSADGREAMLSLLHPGDMFGEMALFDGRPRAADVVAMCDCELIVIDRRDFLAFVKEEPHIALKFIELLCERLRRANEHFEEVIFQSLQVRLARMLLQLVEDNSKLGHPKLKITQREISQMLGATRESVNKQLGALTAANVLSVERGSIVVLSHDALVDIADGQVY